VAAMHEVCDKRTPEERSSIVKKAVNTRQLREKANPKLREQRRKERSQKSKLAAARRTPEQTKEIYDRANITRKETYRLQREERQDSLLQFLSEYPDSTLEEIIDNSGIRCAKQTVKNCRSEGIIERKAKARYIYVYSIRDSEWLV
jgi:hypothetical protein